MYQLDLCGRETVVVYTVGIIRDVVTIRPVIVAGSSPASKASSRAADIAVKIAKVLNVSVEYLVLGKENKEQPNLPNYDSQIRKIADKMMNMSKKEKFLVESMVDAIETSRNQ